MRLRLRLNAFRPFISAVLSAVLVLSTLTGGLSLPMPASAAPVAATKEFQLGLDGYTDMECSNVSQTNPDQNFKSTGLTLRKSSTEDIRIFCQFDLSSIPKNATVHDASFELTRNPFGVQGNGAVPVAIYKVITGWDQDTLTWNNSVAVPIYDPAPIDDQDIDGYASNSKVNLDFTSLVQQWVDGTENDGFMLQVAGLPAGVTFWYRGFNHEEIPDASQATRPKLTVHYTYETTETVLQQGQNGYAGAEDVHLAEDPGLYSPYNYGGMTNDIVGRMQAKADGKKRTLYRFDVSSIPSGAVIVNATLELYLLNGAGIPVTMEAREVLETWVEGSGLNTAPFTTNGVSWDTQPLFGGTAVGAQTVGSTSGWYTFSLTDLVQQWVNGSKPNYGVALVDRNEATIAVNYKTFASSENADIAKRPVLRIQFAAPVVAVTGVDVTPSTVSLIEGGNAVQLSATVLPDTATNRKVTWTSSNLAVATVDANGVVTPVGRGTATITATTDEGNFTDASTVTVSSHNADLSSLTLSEGTLSPAFANGVTGYSATVANSVTEVNVTPTAADANAVITVNGQIVNSGNPMTVPLSVGNNIVKVLVTAEDGTTQKMYTLTVTRPPSTNADLSDLSLSSGTLSPAFASGTLSYNAAVGYEVTDVSVTPSAADTNSTITVNGQAVASGSASASIPLSVGPNTIRVTVKAQDGATQKNYTITVSRAANNDARLTDLKVSEGSLAPVFDWSKEPYRVSVDHQVTSIHVTPTAADANATVKVNGQTVASGAASANVPLNVGPNTITVAVTAQDGSTTKTYTVTVSRAKSANANLNNLRLSEGTLGPAFASGMTAYTATVSNSVYGLSVVPTAADPNATIQVNGAPMLSGSASQAIPLNVGDNAILVTVTAQDGAATKSYMVTVKRAPIDSADLKNLTLSDGWLSPSFDSGVIEYRTTVSNGTTNLKVTPTVADPSATVTANGMPVASGTASQAISLNVGDNTITVVVTGQGGMTKTYAVTVTRAAPNSADLSYLTLSEGSLNPAFSSGVKDYLATVPSHVVSVKVTPWTADSSATVKVNGKTVVNGAPSGPIPLNAGDHTIMVTVTAQDGTTQTYNVTVTRAARANADLINLALSNGGLNPTFAGGVISYTTSVGNGVTSVTATPTAADPNATLSVNGMPVASGGSSPSIPLSAGDNRIEVAVTAEDGVTMKTYTIVVNRTSPSSSDSNSGSDASPATPMPTPDTTKPDDKPSDPTPGATCPTLSWKDAQNHWASSAIEAASQLCLVYGVSKDNYMPDGELTRLQFALMVGRAMKLEQKENSVVLDDFSDRKDIPGWAATELPAAIQAGIIVGYADNTLRPNQKISRAEMVTMLIRGWGMSASQEATPFADESDIPKWAKGYVARAAEIGIIVGRTNNHFDPSGTATRAEAAVVLVKMLRDKQ